VENVARAISDHAAPGDGKGVDLIVMCARRAPVDRDPEHFPAVQLAGELAAAFQAAMHLLLIVPTFATLCGGWVSSSGRVCPCPRR
jgi:hypothetical protein